MSKVITIHQPDFLPWLGFFDRWKNSDLYIVLDDVQFLRRGWHHRDKIKTAHGVVWLTVPVLKKGRFDQCINQVQIDNSRNWRHKHLATLEHAYRAAPGFHVVYPKLKEIYQRPYRLLVDFNMALLEMAAELLGIHTPIVLASRYGLQSRKTHKLVELVERHHGTHYLTGTGARSYLDEQLFHRCGITVTWQNFEHPVYPQLHGPFVPNLSVIDYLMNTNGHGQRNS